MPASACVRDLYPSLKGLSDDALAVQSAAAELYLTRLLGRNISGGSVVEKIDGLNRPVIVLKDVPVRSVEKVVYNTNGARTEYLADSGHFQWSESGMLVLRNDGFPEHLPGWRPGLFNIEVHYTSAGLSQTEQDMLIGGVMFWQSAQAAANPVMSQERIGDYSYATNGASAGAVPAYIQGLIAPYRRLRAI